MKSEISPLSVAAYLGIKKYRSGKNIFIHCPEHYLRSGKNDQRASNCKLGRTFNDAYYCFSCNAHGDIFDLIAHTEGLNRKTDFKEICRIAIESIGASPDDFLLKKSHGKKNEYEEKKAFRYPVLSDEQYKLISIKKNGFINHLRDVYSGETLSEEERNLFVQTFPLTETNGKIQKETEYIEYFDERYSITDLCSQNPELYRKVILSACERTLKKYEGLICGGVGKVLLRSGCSLSKTEVALVLSDLRQRYVEVMSIMNEMGADTVRPAFLINQ